MIRVSTRRSMTSPLSTVGNVNVFTSTLSAGKFQPRVPCLRSVAPSALPANGSCQPHRTTEAPEPSRESAVGHATAGYIRIEACLTEEFGKRRCIDRSHLWFKSVKPTFVINDQQFTFGTGPKPAICSVERAMCLCHWTRVPSCLTARCCLWSSRHKRRHQSILESAGSIHDTARQ